MFSFPEDAPSARRLAEAWGATEGSFVALPGSTAPVEFPRITALFRSRGLPTFPGRTEGMEGSSSGVRRDRRDQADYGGGSLSRFPRLPGYQTDGGWSAQVPFGDRLAQGKHTFTKNGIALRTLRDFGHLLRRDDGMVGFDIKNAYHHLRVQDAQQNFLQFRLEGELFQCVALPFGLSLSPYYFTHLMLAVVRFLRAPLRSCKTIPHFHFGCFAGDTSLSDYYCRYAAGTPADILAYLDDFLAAMRDRADLREWVSLTRRVFNILGFEFKERKCEWEPTQLKRHLGVLIDTRHGLFLIPSEKRTEDHGNGGFLA